MLDTMSPDRLPPQIPNSKVDYSDLQVASPSLGCSGLEVIDSGELEVAPGAGLEVAIGREDREAVSASLSDRLVHEENIIPEGKRFQYRKLRKWI